MKSYPPTLANLLPVYVAVCLIGIGILSLIVDSPTQDGAPLLRHALLFCLPISLLGVGVIVVAWLRLVSPGYLAAAGILYGCTVRFVSDVGDQLLGGPTRPELPVYISIGAVTFIAASVMLVIGSRAPDGKLDVET